ncbi:hypothetical protein M0R04_07500 [Candidatus Dojkabacteria bacterium]|jgi:hypothetical protein|nr:hypothetical protein [Candidatus Dojkabacteria bacterium]
MLTENTPPISFQVFVNGVPFGDKQPSMMLAEMIVCGLPSHNQHLVEIRPITSTGKQILFG